jgi:ADP-ribosylation factor 2-binding protein
MDIESSLCALDEVVADSAFKQYQQEFVQAHCHLFDNIEENKLEYTELHKQYEAQIEAYLEQQLAKYPGFSMEALMEGLPAYIGSPEATDHAATLDFLHLLTDFEAFKMLMVEALTAAQNGGNDAAGEATIALPQNVNQALEECAALAQATADPALGWQNVLKKGWLNVDRYKPEGRNEAMRTVIDCGMPVENAVEMMLSCDMNERKNWDSMMTVELMENYGPNDDLVKYSVKVPFMSPLVYIIRLVQVPDFPEPGCVTAVYVAPETGDAAAGKKPEGLGNIVIKPNGPNGSIMTSIEEVPQSMFPNFMMNWFISSMTPRMMSATLSKYKKYRGLA